MFDVKMHAFYMEKQRRASQKAEEMRAGMTLALVFHVSFFSLCVCFSAQQCNPGDLRALRKGMSLYHSESQLSSLPQRQDAMHVVSSREEQTEPHRTP